MMQLQVTDKVKWNVIDGNDGTIYLPIETVGILNKNTAFEYYEGSRIDVVEIVEGYGARYSSPGYLDCTPWIFSDFSAAEAEKECKDLFADDDEYFEE